MSRQAMPVQTGKIIDYLNSGSTVITVGAVVPLKSFCGIAETDIATGEKSAVAINGVWEVTAVSGTAFEVGDIVYWNAAGGYVTKSKTNNTLFGVVVEPKATSVTKARAKIGVALAEIVTA